MATPNNSVSNYFAPRVIKSTFKRRGDDGHGDSGVLSDTHDGSSCTLSKTGWKNGPNWRRSIGKSDVGLGYSLVSSITHHGFSSCTLVQKLTPTDPFYPGTITYQTDGGFASPSAAGDPNAVDVSQAEIKAKSGAIQRVKELQTSFQGGVFLGELAETIHMIKNPAKALRSGIDAFYQVAKKRTKNGYAATSERILAETWLEFQYGWKPLAADLEDASKTVARASRYFGVNRHFGSQSTYQSSATTFGSYTPPTTGIQYRWERRTISTGTISYAGEVRVAPGQTDPMRNAWGVSTRDFLPTVWELIPYSFLADYFSNIGEIIDGFSYCLGNLVYLCKSTKKESSCFTGGLTLNAPTSNVLNHSENFDQSSQRRTTFSRAMQDSSALVPSFGVKLPGSSTRFLNIAALGTLKLR